MANFERFKQAAKSAKQNTDKTLAAEHLLGMVSAITALIDFNMSSEEIGQLIEIKKYLLNEVESLIK